MQELTADFSDLLSWYVERSGYRAGQLARLTNTPKRTIANWLEGRVQRPRERDDLLKIGRALHLNHAELNKLLCAAGHPPQDQEKKPVLHAMQTPTAPAIHKTPQAQSPPFQAVADIPYFIGRETELNAIKQALLTRKYSAICSLQGMAGVGKTVLAAHIAYLLRPYFPDGVLWGQVDTADTMSILHAFADAYNRNVHQYTNIASRSQAVREMLAHKQALLVLDNVQSSTEVEPLLPPSGASAILITTRRHDLAITCGVQRFQIMPFHPQHQEALSLFAAVLGGDIVNQQRDVFAQIAAKVGYLPLAIFLVASRLAYEPDWSAVTLLARLSSPTTRLNELIYENINITATFAQSAYLLTPLQRNFFIALSEIKQPAFDAGQAAKATGMPLAETQAHLRKLYACSLILHSGNGLYTFHTLVRDYCLWLNSVMPVQTQKMRADTVIETAVLPAWSNWATISTSSATY